MTSTITYRYSILSRSCIVTHKWTWGAFQLIKYLTFSRNHLIFDTFLYLNVKRYDIFWNFAFFIACMLHIYMNSYFDIFFKCSLICILQGYCWGNVWSCVWILHGKYFMNNLFDLDNNIRFIYYRIFFRNMTCKSFCLEICLSCWWVDAPKL